MQMCKKKLYVVAGPTAVGKTKYSIELAKRVNGEIVSLDSMQVYKGLDIGTAKIKDSEKQGITHHMIDIIEPNVNINVKEFKDMANICIESIYSKGKIPVLVGGTGFYIRSILYDTDFLYEDDAVVSKIRKELYDKLSTNGIEFLYEELKKVDIKSAEKIPIGNIKRIIRALEFYKLHNIPISDHNEKELSKESKYDFTFYVLYMDREKLYDRINKRVDNMIEDGLLREVKMLVSQGLSKDMNAMRGIGYSELYDFCKKQDMINNVSMLNEELKVELKIIIDEIKMHTRNYAKRQLTWFRSQKNISWINVDEDDF